MSRCLTKVFYKVFCTIILYANQFRIRLGIYINYTPSISLLEVLFVFMAKGCKEENVKRIDDTIRTVNALFIIVLLR